MGQTAGKYQIRMANYLIEGYGGHQAFSLPCYAFGGRRSRLYGKLTIREALKSPNDVSKFKFYDVAVIRKSPLGHGFNDSQGTIASVSSGLFLKHRIAGMVTAFKGENVLHIRWTINQGNAYKPCSGTSAQYQQQAVHGFTGGKRRP